MIMMMMMMMTTTMMITIIIIIIIIIIRDNYSPSAVFTALIAQWSRANA